MIRYIDIHTHKPAKGVTTVVSLRAGEDAQSETGLFSAGIHPWDAAGGGSGDALEYLRHAPAAAIGEIGLDYARDTDRESQQDVLRAQLEIAVERNLPVILHCVKAYNDMLGILPDYNLQAVIFHSYTGSPQLTRTITGRGYYISAGPVSLRSRKTRESLKDVPDGLIFAETDDSGVKIEDIYAELAAIRGIGPEELAAIIENNFKTIFG